MPKPPDLPLAWGYSSVFGPSLLLVAPSGSAAAKTITWFLEDQEGRRIGDGYIPGEDGGPGYVVWKEQFRPLPGSRTFKAVVGNSGEAYSVEFIAPPPPVPR